jgi:hypothetical protein
MANAAFQELATRISHRNTGQYSDDPVADKVMLRVAADENLLRRCYRDVVAAALQVDPSAGVEANTGEVVGFDMPGVGIQGFTRKALQMAQAGIYDLRIHHDEVLWPLLRYWNLFQVQGLRPEAEQARDRLAAYLAKTDRLASRFEAKRAATAAANEASAAGSAGAIPACWDDQLASRRVGTSRAGRRQTRRWLNATAVMPGRSPPGYRRWSGKVGVAGWLKGRIDGVWADTPLQATRPPRTSI